VGDFTLSLSGNYLQLEVGNNYEAPNTTSASPLKWTKNADGLWTNYSTTSKSPANWTGKVTFDSVPVDVTRYLDDDHVIFEDRPNTPEITVLIGREGVRPASVVFNNETTTYTLGGPLTDDSGGPIGGETSLVKNNTGTLILRGTNAYSGGTEVYGGFIDFDNLANFGKYTEGKITLDGGGLRWGINSAAGATSNTTDISRWLEPIGTNGGTFDTNDNDVTFSSALTGVTNDGGIIKKGEGTLTLKGNNIYSGATVIDEGALEITGTLGYSPTGNDYAGDIEIADTAALIFNPNATQTLSGPITGTGNLTLTAGHLNLTNTANLTGAFYVASGTLGLGASDKTTLKAGSAEIGSNVILDIVGYSPNTDTSQITSYPAEGTIHTLIEADSAITGDFAGILVGGKPFPSSSTNEKTFLDVYQIGKTEDNTKFQVGLGLVWNKSKDAHGTFDVAKEFTLNVGLAKNPISSAWTTFGWDGETLTKSGAGTLILNASNNIGAVEVKAGSLIVGDAGHENVASLSASAVEVNRGAVLGGYGTILPASANAEVVIKSGGILSPGNSYGTFTIETKTTFEPGSVLEVEVNPDDPQEGDRLIVKNGTATLTGGTVSHVSSVCNSSCGYLTPGNEWLILSADNRVGEFANAVSSLAYLVPHLRYDDNGTDVYLSFTRKRLGPIFDTLPEGPLLDEIMNIPEDQWPRILNELSGEAHATLKGDLLRLDDAFTRRVIRHVGAKSAQRGTGDDLWISVNQTYQVADGNTNAGRATLRGTDVSGGHDAALDDGWLAGLAFRFGTVKQDVNSRRSEADVISSTAALYGGREIPFDSGTLRVLLSGALTLHEVDSERHVRIGSNDQKLKTTYDGQSFVGAFETAYRMSPTEKLAVEPYASVAWHSLHLEDFKEKGGTAALKKKGETWNRATSTLGMRLSTSPQARVTFDADIGWQHLYGSATPKSAFAFRGGSGRFTTRGADVNKDAAILGLSVGVKVAKDAKISLQYDGELGSQGQSHGGQVVFEMKW
jgi:outer membrane autotransporter protein